MHTDLSAHLHSDGCNDLIRQLTDCRSNNPFYKFFGACNDYDRDVTACLKKERLARRQRNFDKSIEMKKRWAERASVEEMQNS